MPGQRARPVRRAGTGRPTLEREHGVPSPTQHIPFDTGAANLVFHLIASRYETASTIVTSNRAFSRWNEIFGDEIVAAAMIDRLVHHAEVLTLSGDSYRTRARRELLAKDRDN
jgi:hypothetical protein